MLRACRIPCPACPSAASHPSGLAPETTSVPPPTSPARPAPARPESSSNRVSAYSVASPPAGPDPDPDPTSTGRGPASYALGGTNCGIPARPIRIRHWSVARAYPSPSTTGSAGSHRWWCRTHRATRLSRLVGPPSCHGRTWCSSHRCSGTSHPGNAQCPSRRPTACRNAGEA
jgi:hypothetical protein